MPTFSFQVVVDCAHPHVLADWWADALGWVVEDGDPAFIQRMIDEGLATPDDTTTHRGVLVWKTAEAIRHPSDPNRGPRRRILFQLVPEPKTVKNRLHLDINVDDVEREVARLVEAGATFLHRGQEGPSSWVTLADPEGNEFCVH
jgi:hypothetical protein